MQKHHGKSKVGDYVIVKIYEADSFKVQIALVRNRLVLGSGCEEVNRCCFFKFGSPLLFYISCWYGFWFECVWCFLNSGFDSPPTVVSRQSCYINKIVPCFTIFLLHLSCYFVYIIYIFMLFKQYQVRSQSVEKNDVKVEDEEPLDDYP